jgi:predicted nucleic acid-binding protein
VILVDTSIWIDLLIDPSRVPEADTYLPEFVTCGPVIQEVLQGVANIAVIDILQDRLLAFPRLADPVPMEPFLGAAKIYREGRRKGYTIRSTVDCLIAAIAIEHNATVWHRDRDFSNIARYTTLREVSRYVT